MPRAEFEPKTPAFERANTVHALERAATVIGVKKNWFTVLERHVIFSDAFQCYVQVFSFLQRFLLNCDCIFHLAYFNTSFSAK
jgi:hypothetical protein